MVNIKESPSPNRSILSRSCELMEARRQMIKPAPKGFYSEQHKAFIDSFTSRPDVSIRNTNEILLVGQESLFDEVLPPIMAEREIVKNVSGKSPEKFIIFLGDGKTMAEQYRAIGSSQQPYPYAISGALSCYLNTDYMQDGLNPASKRATKHEPRHVMASLTLTDANGNPTFQMDKNKLIYEAFGGPSNPDDWNDVDSTGINIDFNPLITGKAEFWDWYNQATTLNQCGQEYFLNPVAKAFYDWAANQGGDSYWYDRAKSLDATP